MKKGWIVALPQTTWIEETRQKQQWWVFPSSEVKLIHLGNQLDFSSSSVSSTVVIESTNSEDMKLEAPLSAITASSSCTWFLREMAVPLDQEDWKNEHGKRFMPSMKEYLEWPITADPSEFTNGAAMEVEDRFLEFEKRVEEVLGGPEGDE